MDEIEGKGLSGIPSAKLIRHEWLPLAVSMIDGKFFDKLEQVGRMVRDDMKPFGGIQIILCGE